MKKSTWLHLRIPFSFFLLPVFLLACAVANEVHWDHFWLAFVALHLFIYPASNGYNSYFDKDEDSIGGLEKPPPVSRDLYGTALIFDVTGLALGLWISVEFTIMLFVYGMISKAYSHPSVRLKKLPIAGWLAAGVFQGYFTYIMSYMALRDVSVTETFSADIQIPGMLSSILLLGSYPMTQIYQHDEDARRGDMTMSRLLGIRGTFHFTMLIFTLATAGFCLYFWFFIDVFHLYLAILFPVFLSPVLIYFFKWYLQVRHDEQQANFKHAMRLNLISSVMLNLFFAFWWYVC